MQELEYVASPPKLEQILARTTNLGFDMASESRTGALLRTLAASKPGGQFLELGTGTGISTAWLLHGMDAASRLTSVDTDAGVQEVAREFLGEDQRLSLVQQDARAFLNRQPDNSFDFVFADAMPGKYDGIEDCLRVVKCGGFYIVDDMLPQANWPTGHADKASMLLERLAGDKGLSICPLAWASGMVVAVKLR